MFWVGWLGIVIFVSFSIGLSLFMRLEPREPRVLPADLGRWKREPGHDPETYIETRLWLFEGGLLRPHRLVKQRRVRAQAGGRILQVLPEVLVERWRGGFQRSS